MIDLSHLLLEIIAQSGIYALTTMAVYITKKVMEFDDLTIEGSFGLGGAIAAKLLCDGFPAPFTLLIGAASGALAGIATGLISRFLPISKVISGLVVTAALYSLSLGIGTSFLSLAHHSTLFNHQQTSFFSSPLFIISAISGLLWLSIKYLLTTEIGFMLAALGHNPQMLTNLGKRITLYTLLGLGIANSLTAFAGSLFAHYLGFFSITGQIGTMIIALTSLMIAELFGHDFKVNIIIGSIIFQSIITLTIAFQIDPVWNRLITALLLVILMIIKKIIMRNGNPCLR